MMRFAARFFLLIFPSLLGASSWAQSSAAHLEETTARKSTAAIAPIAHQQLFGSIPLSTRSAEARKFEELALDKYENHITDDAETHAREAIKKDPQFALGYATLSLASLAGIPNTAALEKAKALLPRATPDEQLLVRWMTSVGERDLLPAISAMNDLLKRYPNDKHVLYLIADWLYYQQDYDRARNMLETIHRIDSDFPPALNLLAYAYIQTGTPDPQKAIASLKRYAEVQPASPNPEDSLGEISRYTGDDQSSLEHYAHAVKIDPTFISSQWGLGDTSALMGNYVRARAEFDRAIAMATNPRDRFHAEYQKALVYFWEGQPVGGRKAFDALYEKALQQKEPYSVFEIGFGRAMLAADLESEAEQLRAIEVHIESAIAGMSELDRNNSLAAVLRERTRIAAIHGDTKAAEEAIAKLERLAAESRDTIVANSYESARGYLFFSQGDFAKAADNLSSDPRSLLVLQDLASAQDKLGDAAAAALTRTRIKYLRAPTIEWYLINHAESND